MMNFFLLFALALGPIQDLLDLVGNPPQQKILQEGKERWEMEDPYKDKFEEAWPLLREIGCIDAIHAKKMHYDYALLLGSGEKVMLDRLDFLYEEYKRGVRFDKIYLLTGQRDLRPKEAPFGTETKLFIHLLENHPLKNTAPYFVIDTPKDEGRERPTTINTFVFWLKTSPTPGSCLLISSQPFVDYQHAIFKTVIPNNFPSEAIGSENTIPYKMGEYLDNIARWGLYSGYEDLSPKSLSDSAR